MWFNLLMNEQAEPEHLTALTDRSCRTSISEAFSEMFPTNTVVVGPPVVAVLLVLLLLSSVPLACVVIASFLVTVGFCVTETVEGTSTYCHPAQKKTHACLIYYLDLLYTHQLCTIASLRRPTSVLVKTDSHRWRGSHYTHVNWNHWSALNKWQQMHSDLVNNNKQMWEPFLLSAHHTC